MATTNANLILATLTAALAASGCGGDFGDLAGPAGGEGGSTPEELLGSWYAGRGGTSSPYDPATGAFGRPNGQGLIYVFEAGGRYRKAFQSYASNGGCTNGFTAHEEGSLTAEAHTLQLRPTSGHLLTEDTCAPSLNSDEPLTGLGDESFTWELRPAELDAAQTELLLQRSDGAASTFHRL